MRHIILVTGGERSGKSSYAEQRALATNERPVYVATARIWDEEFRQRVAVHRERRDERWDCIEEEKYLSRHDLTGRTVVVDCVTLWCTNFFFDRRTEDNPSGTEEETAEQARLRLDATLEEMKEEIARFTAHEATYIFVTNEIGMGGVPAHPVQRQFTDLLGWLNQHLAALADEVVLMVSGIPVIIKKS